MNTGIIFDEWILIDQSFTDLGKLIAILHVLFVYQTGKLFYFQHLKSLISMRIRSKKNYS